MKRYILNLRKNKVHYNLLLAAFWLLVAILFNISDPIFKIAFLTPLIYCAKAGFCYVVNRTYHARAER